MGKKESYELHVSHFFGPYVLARRRELGISQVDLAKDVKVSAQFMGRIEKGLVPVPESIQAELVVMLKVPQSKMKDIYSRASKARISSLLEAVKAKRSTRNRPR